MSVYTIVAQHELEAFLTHYAIGTLISYKGINAGIDNTNYFVTTTQGEFVLTLFEHYQTAEIHYFLDLMAYLAEHEVPSAHPIADQNNSYFRELNNKPAAFVKRLCGHDVKVPTLAQCEAVGATLGHLHIISPDFPQHRDNFYSAAWLQRTTDRVLPYLNAQDAELLRDEIGFQHYHRERALPRGVVHADLFRDNALFEADKLCGVIDFYRACDDSLLYDVAITINDWCSLPNGHLEMQRMSALFNSYQQKRALTAAERDAWHPMLRAAALQFWVSRLEDMHFPKEGEMTHIKDPEVFKCILQARRQGL